MQNSNLLGRKEDIKAILKALGIKEGNKPKQSFFPREIIEVMKEEPYRVQSDWIDYFNENKQVMISMPDLYHAGKEGDKNLIANVRECFSSPWLITSTRITNKPISLVKEGKSRIIHHYKSKMVKPVEKVVVIPVYRPKKISEIVYTGEGLTFIQSLFGTKDDKDTIIEVLEELSGRSKDSIVVWSQAKVNKEKYHETPVDCDYDGKDFRIICSAYDFLGGCTCRVSD